MVFWALRLRIQRGYRARLCIMCNQLIGLVFCTQDGSPVHSANSIKALPQLGLQGFRQIGLVAFLVAPEMPPTTCTPESMGSSSNDVSTPRSLAITACLPSQRSTREGGRGPSRDNRTALYVDGQTEARADGAIASQ